MSVDGLNVDGAREEGTTRDSSERNDTYQKGRERDKPEKALKVAMS